MSDVYKELLEDPVQRQFVGAAAVGRLPMSMLGIATVLTVATSLSSYALAGAVSATMLLCQCVTAPVIGRTADRRGQGAVLRPVIAVHVLGLLAMVAVVTSDLPVWMLFVAGAVAGGSFPPIGSFVRMRWRHRLGHGVGLRAAFSLEAAIDEFAYIFGPLVVVGLGWMVAPWAGLLAAAILTAVGGLSFAALHRTEPPAAVAAEPGAPSGHTLGLAVVLLAALAFGTVMGAVEVSMVAFGEQEGSTLVSGPLIAAFSVGSIVAGLAYGARTWRLPASRLFLIATSFLAVATVPLIFAADVPRMALAITVAGFAFAPALILAYELVDVLVPHGKETQGFAWMQTSLGGGLAIGAAIAGHVVEVGTPHRGFTVAAVGAAAAVAFILVGAKAWRPLPLPGGPA